MRFILSFSINEVRPIWAEEALSKLDSRRNALLLFTEVRSEAQTALPAPDRQKDTRVAQHNSIAPK